MYAELTLVNCHLALVICTTKTRLCLAEVRHRGWKVFLNHEDAELLCVQPRVRRCREQSVTKWATVSVGLCLKCHLHKAC